jgi:hypothetical protein
MIERVHPASAQNKGAATLGGNDCEDAVPHGKDAGIRIDMHHPDLADGNEAGTAMPPQP